MSQARLWFEHLAPKEWGNELMAKIAADRLAADQSLDLVEVWEHGGWHLTFNRLGMVVGTANDMAQFRREVTEWCQQFDGTDIVGECRRHDDGQHRDCVYPVRESFPRLAVCA